MTNERALQEQRVGKLLFSLSLPVILIMIVQVLYNMADVFFLGKTGDPLQVAAVSLAMIVMGICMGMQPAISYTYGRGDRKRLRDILLGTGTASVVTATILAVIFFLGRDAFVRAFLDNGEILALGRRMILGGLAAAPLVGVYQLCSVYLQSTGRVAYATVTALMQKGLVYVPVLYLMNTAFGLTGLIFSSAVTDVVSMLAALVLCFKSVKGQEELPIERIFDTITFCTLKGRFCTLQGAPLIDSAPKA